MKIKTNGVAYGALEFLQKEQLKNRELWKKFVDVFRTHPDSENRGWRGEFWGKMMRGGALVYECTQDSELYDILTESVKDMLTTAEADGRVSSYEREREFNSWDIWCRKYVILACEYYLEICKDEALKNNIIVFIKRCADYIIDNVGSEDGKMAITDTSVSWYGMNSSSILEPIVRLYNLTKEQKYLDFATHIVECGGAKGINIFELAYEDKVYPFQYGISKAYEMISCFEGLLEYYYATGNERYKTAVINFANAVIKTELSVIGSCGITHELFDYTSARQTVRQNDVSQETCVTVTWMKFCSRLLELTGDAKFADCMEQSFYNAYMGAFNTDHCLCPYVKRKFEGQAVVDDPLPVDSYSPLISGTRGVKVGGNQLLPDLSHYGCCACIASAGIGVFVKNMVTADQNGITVNFFENGTVTLKYEDATVEIEQKTRYPIDGAITLHIRSDVSKQFELKVRMPAWTGSKEGYVVYKKEWLDDTIEIVLPMNIRTQLPEKWEFETIYTDMSKRPSGQYTAIGTTVYHDPDDDNYIALMRGPLTLAADSRSGKDAGDVFDFESSGELCRDKEITDGVPCLLKMKFTDKEGKDFYLVDYSSAGKDWTVEIAAWLKTK